MFQMTYCDGTPVEASYSEFVTKLVSAACVAEEHFSLDELEDVEAGAG